MRTGVDGQMATIRGECRALPHTENTFEPMKGRRIRAPSMITQNPEYGKLSRGQMGETAATTMTKARRR